MNHIRGENRAKLVEESVHNPSERKHFFTNRIVRNWNDLPDSVVESDDVNKFKAALDEHIKIELFLNENMYIDILLFLYFIIKFILKIVVVIKIVSKN